MNMKKYLIIFLIFIVLSISGCSKVDPPIFGDEYYVRFKLYGKDVFLEIPYGYFYNASMKGKDWRFVNKKLPPSNAFTLQIIPDFINKKFIIFNKESANEYYKLSSISSLIYLESVDGYNINFKKYESRLSRDLKYYCGSEYSCYLNKDKSEGFSGYTLIKDSKDSGFIITMSNEGEFNGMSIINYSLKTKYLSVRFSLRLNGYFIEENYAVSFAKEMIKIVNGFIKDE
ncbi:hypothetical protein VQ643_16115 [Pseudomonas sp. F1_0610]|uniref:hypothetical protein n=1 Tax=Pseudomonas sp. F1_0610 TaxID=3114284 RepID=UPI0039C3D268